MKSGEPHSQRGINASNYSRNTPMARAAHSSRANLTGRRVFYIQIQTKEEIKYFQRFERIS